jgi:hypothetical protein
MHVIIDYASYYELPPTLQCVDGPINSPMLIEVFERTLSPNAAVLLETMQVKVCLTRDAFKRPTKLIQYENELILTISIGRWLLVMDRVPRSGRILLESLLYHESIVVEQCRTHQLVLETGHEDLIVWQGSQYINLESGAEYLDQPWSKEAFMQEAVYLVEKQMFPTFNDAWEYIIKERV